MAAKLALGMMTLLVAAMAVKAQFGIVPLNNVPVPGVGHGYGRVPVADFYAYPRYKYSYGVEDGITGDFKTASEHRDGDVVTGHYSLREPDGNLRHVTYVADRNGFRANVQRNPGIRGY